MTDLAPLENFSALDDWLPAAAQWRPFRPQATHEQEARDAVVDE
jgi:hypothetical protein